MDLCKRCWFYYEGSNTCFWKHPVEASKCEDFHEMSEEDLARRELRKVFDRKVDRLMEKHGYVDVDEGTYEAITERESGFVRFWDEEGRSCTWAYWITENRRGVVLSRLGGLLSGYEGSLE